MPTILRFVLSFALTTAAFMSEAIACTAFSFSTGKGPIYAANLDLGRSEGHVFVNPRGLLKESYRRNAHGEALQWETAYGSVTLNLVGREMPWGGMNQAGLCGTTLQLMVARCPEVGERVPLGEANLLQYLLDTCASVDEALVRAAGVSLAPWECSAHYMLTDATGASAVIEFLDGRMVTYSGEDLPVQALANAPYESGVVFCETGRAPEFNPGASVQRMADAQRVSSGFVEQDEANAIDFAMNILTKVVVSEKKWWKGMFGEPYTRWSVVYDIARREIHFRTVERKEIRRVHLDAFDFACDAPLLMLEVNAELSGWIDNAFEPYDRQANLEIFQDFCESWGLDVSDDDAESLMVLFDEYCCAGD